MKLVLAAIVIIVLLSGYLVSFLIATASHDPDVWHKDPLTVATSETPNSFRMAPAGSTRERIDMTSPVYSEPAVVMAQAFDEFVLQQRATVRIAGLPPELMMTYVQRSEALKFPDYVSVKFMDLGDGTSTIAVYSRARYGYADMGVNQARVERWVKTLQTFEVEPGQ